MLTIFEEPYHDYWFYLGKFIHAFAQTESELLQLLTHVVGLSKIRAGALFSGVRQEGARDNINYVLLATRQIDKKQRLEKPFAQIATIGTVRNNVVHWGASTDWGGSFLVSNEHRKPMKPKTFKITTKDFDDMLHDLYWVAEMLRVERGVSQYNNADYKKLFRVTWRYKPPQPYPPTNTQR